MAKFLVKAKISYGVDLGVMEFQNARKAAAHALEEFYRTHHPSEYRHLKLQLCEDVDVYTEGGEFIGSGVDLKYGGSTEERFAFERGENSGFLKALRCLSPAPLKERLAAYFASRKTA